MPDIVRTVTNESWFSRIKNAFFGVLFGGLLVIVAFPLLWWNEGRAVHRARSLAEGASVVVEARTDAVDTAHDGKLVHVEGLANSDEILADPALGISASGLRLKRIAETYQWREESSSRKRKKFGGSEETIKEYRYSKTWSRSRIDSSGFNSPSGHENPPSLAWEPTTVTASRVSLGAFTLPPSLVEKIDRSEARPAEPSDEAAMQAHGFRSTEGGTYYKGANPSNPQIGDVRVRFEVTKPETVSIIAQQRGTSFEAYHARAGSDILLLEEGQVPAEAMFKAARTANTVLTWVLRGAGLFAMFLGLVLILRPLSVLGSVVPLIGSVIGAGTGLLSFLVALVLSLVTIAVAWVAYRPLLGISLLAAAAAVLVLLLRSRPARAPKPVVPPPIPT